MYWFGGDDDDNGGSVVEWLAQGGRANGDDGMWKPLLFPMLANYLSLHVPSRAAAGRAAACVTLRV